jgi:uncharacterized protein YkuJ
MRDLRAAEKVAAHTRNTRYLTANHRVVCHVKFFDRGHKICLLSVIETPARVSLAHKK